jgi:hypothetical protein
MYPTLMVATCATIIILIPWISSLASAGDGQPSLAETLAWMDSTYNPHMGAGGSWGHGREEIFSAGRAFKRRISTFEYDGCNFTINQKDDPTAPLYSDLYTSSTFKFNLRDIDLKSIKLERLDPQYGGLSCDYNTGGMICTIAEMEIETQNQAPLMTERFHIVWPKLKGSEHEAFDSKETFVSALYFDDAEYAERFSKALRHAVTLCGGKSSPF